MDQMDDILAERLGPPPMELLRQLMERHPDMAAVVVVVELADGEITAFSGGCTMLETLGMLSYASVASVRGKAEED